MVKILWVAPQFTEDSELLRMILSLRKTKDQILPETIKKRQKVIKYDMDIKEHVIIKN